MINPRIFCILLLLLLSFLKGFSQKQEITETDIFTNAKVFFLNQDTSFYTSVQALNFLGDTSNCELLPSK
ncbi:MAG TPA: hypothetical protein VK927_08835, partial [Adhaeribacter sp.]|nr:hypothetical protein [Adhaeribacter sp.]